LIAPGYEIRVYSPEFLPPVVDLMQHLWGKDPEANLRYFRWKHIDNPYSKHPLGILALHRGKVVGFRAYFPLKYQAGAAEHDFILLVPGDTCVHPDHRRKGLSVAMGRRAAAEFGPTYKVFLNTSVSRATLPGNLKLGFLPLAPKFLVPVASGRVSWKDYIPRRAKKILRRSPLSSAYQSLRRREKQELPRTEGPELGEFGEFLISDRPRPSEMTRIAAEEPDKKRKIKLIQDETFFRWRFQNNKNNYFFYYFRSGQQTTGYIVVGKSPEDDRASILDYGERESRVLDKLLRFLVDSGKFQGVAVQSFGINDSLLQALTRTALSRKALLRKRKQCLPGELALLVRPVKENPTEDDWTIHGMDIRKFDNWEIKPISCDGE